MRVDLADGQRHARLILDEGDHLVSLEDRRPGLPGAAAQDWLETGLRDEQPTTRTHGVNARVETADECRQVCARPERPWR